MSAVASPHDSTNRNPLRTRICDLFGVEYPIVQTGMGWVSGATLTAATSSAGGLGIIAAATLTFAEMQEAVWQVKKNHRQTLWRQL